MKLALTVDTHLLTNDLYARLSLHQGVCVAVHRLVKPKCKSWVKARWIPAKNHMLLAIENTKGLMSCPTSQGLTKRVMGLWRLPWVLKTMAADVGEIMNWIVQKKGSACCRALVIGLGSIE